MSPDRSQRRKEFEQTALVHFDAMYGTACRLTRNPRDAEDLVQEAVLRAYRFWDSFQRDSNCKAWLLRIVTNTFINEYQRKKRSRQILDLATSEQAATDGVLIHADSQTNRGADKELARRAISDEVQQALDTLPDDFRHAVVLCDMQGLSYKEIAEIMECPVGTVMSRLFRGRKLLATALREFAVAEGYVREQPQAQARTASGDAPIDLNTYRAAQRREEKP
ncbi:MAG: sigma-70 family RNA polymerase sigma factor [Kofleriaceae bacterium]